MTLILYCYLCSCVNEDQCSFDDQNTKVSSCEILEDPDDIFSDFVTHLCSLEPENIGEKVSKARCRNGAGRCCHKVRMYFLCSMYLG